MHNKLLLICFSLFPMLMLAQSNWQTDESYPLSPENYTKNDYYWQQRRPSSEYWQQDVHYRILANLKPQDNVIEGNETLLYTNNSPDILNVVYFHLYQNAFTKGSYLDKLGIAENRKIDFGENGNAGKGTQILGIYQNGKPVRYQIDNTIMKVFLEEVIAPNAKVEFQIKFNTYFSEGTSYERRMKMWNEKVRKPAPDNSEYDVKHFDVTHWYPRICVYDRKFRWCLDQHLGNEFYGDFGSFDVHINIPSYYILDGTGVLQNEDEALPADVKAKINIENFKDKKWNEVATELYPPNNQLFKRWVFHAENVHDFAFTADPTYRRGEVRLGNVRCISLAREPHAARWQDAANFAARVINVYNNDIGEYLYPKMVVADADDGMEYPMLTLDGGGAPDYYSLFAHEIGHNWFYGMIGTNETYRAFMDEGFTQFLQNWCMEKLDYGMDNRFEKFKFIVENTSSRQLEIYAPYLKDAKHGYDGMLNTHSDHFGKGDYSQNYGQVYTKTATMLYNLKYVLGEEMFLNAMKYYFNKWKIKHPYPEDFRQSIIEFTKQDLNWFFDQWLETDKQIDYRVRNVKSYKGDSTKIVLERKGMMQMPLDMWVITKTDTFKYYIPNSEYIKPTKENVQTLQKWTGWGNLAPYYNVYLPVQNVKQVIIDPSHELADINLLNNSLKKPLRLHVRLFPKFNIMGDWEHYNVTIRPNIWWNGYSGFQWGIDMRGNYMNDWHKFTANVWYNSGLLAAESPIDALRVYKNDFHRISYRLKYETPLTKISRNMYYSFAGQFRDGLHHYTEELSYKIPKGNYKSSIYQLFSVRYTFMLRPNEAYKDYLFLPYNWNIGKSNAFVQLIYEKSYKSGTNSTGKMNVTLRTSAIGSQSSYAYLRFQSLYEWQLAKLNLRYRLFGQYGIGNFPLESALYLSGGNPEEMYAIDFYRGRRVIPYDWISGNKTGHIGFGGGLNLRGYSGFNVQTDGNQQWYGSTGAALNLELDFNKYVHLPNWVHTYAFFDGGILGRNSNNNARILEEISWGKFLHNAGLGVYLEPKIPYANLTLFRFRADFPLYLNQPPLGEKNWKFRWVLSLNRSF